MGRRTYQPLRQLLAQLPADTHELVLSFADIGALLGQALPSSALNTSFWMHSTAARGNWLAAGFSAKRLPRQRLVHFTRQPAADTAPSCRPS